MTVEPTIMMTFSVGGVFAQSALSCDYYWFLIMILRHENMLEAARDEMYKGHDWNATHAAQANDIWGVSFGSVLARMQE